MQSSLGRNGEDCLIKHAVELPSLALQIIIVEHGIVLFFSKSIPVFLWRQFLTLSPSHFLLCPLSLPSPSFRLAYCPLFLPFCFCPHLPSCFLLTKAGIKIVIWRHAQRVLTNSSTVEAPMALTLLLRAAKWQRLCWLGKEEPDYVQRRYMFFGLYCLCLTRLLLLCFLVTAPSAFIWIWGDGRWFIHSCFFVLAIHSVQSRDGHFNSLWKSLSSRSWRGKLHHCPLGW